VDELRDAKQKLESALNTQPINIEMPKSPRYRKSRVDIPQIPALDSHLSIPGTLGYVEVDENGNEVGAVGGFNAFDLQCRLRVTFLLIGMLMGVSLALSTSTTGNPGAPALRLGAAVDHPHRQIARAIRSRLHPDDRIARRGWALFGISLGHAPAALLMPASAIALRRGVRADRCGIGRTRDAVLPVGAIVIMTMARSADAGGQSTSNDVDAKFGARAATTWAMRAFNDLMIRHLTASSALVPTAVNLDSDHLHDFGVAIARRRFG